MSGSDFHGDEDRAYVQEMSSDLRNSLPTTGLYWAFVILTAFVLISYQWVGGFAILYESGSFVVPRLIFTKSSRGADTPSTFTIFMFCYWYYVVVHEIAHKNDVLGKFLFVAFTLVSTLIGFRLLFAIPETLIPLELTTEKGVNFFKILFRLVILFYQILCSVIIFTFLLSETRLILSPYGEDSSLGKNMATFPLWFPFISSVFVVIIAVTIEMFVGGDSTTDSSSSAHVDITAVKTAEVKAQIESVFLPYQQVNYVWSTIFLDGSTVESMGITVEGVEVYWQNALGNIVSELREIAPLARITLYDTDVNILYTD